MFSGDKQPDNNKRRMVQDIVVRIARPVKDVRFLPPPNTLQRFWQQRALRIVIGVIVVVGLIGGAAGVLYQLFFKSVSNNLYTYVPNDAWLYIEFDTSTELSQQLAVHAPVLAQKAYGFMRDEGVTDQLVQQSTSLGLVGMYTPDNEPAWLWLVRTPDPYGLEASIMPNTYVKHISSEIMAFSTHQEILREVHVQRPLAGYRNASREVPVAGFVKPMHMPHARHQVTLPKRTIQQLVISLVADQAIPFSAAVSSRGFVISMDDTVPPVIDDDAWEFTQRLAQYDIVMQHANLTDGVRAVEQVFSNVPVTQFFIGRAKAFMREHYGSGWERLIDMFDAPSTIAAQYRKYDEDAPWYAGLSGVIEVQRTFAPYEHELVLFALSNTIARSTPEVVTHTLPDGSTGKERIADPSLYGFTRDEHAVFSVVTPEQEVLVRPGKNAYIISNDAALFAQQATQGIDDGEGYCTQYSEKLFLSQHVLRHLSLMDDFSSVMISRDASSMRVCLTF